MYFRLIAQGLWLGLWLAPTTLATGQPTAPAASTLAFAEERIEGAREGYFTLSWNGGGDAAFYRVTGDDGEPVYEGLMNSAFLSGLPDGTYRYRVQALDASGQVILESENPATVIVEHWGLTFAMYLFSVGLIVVLVVLIVIAQGALRAAREGGAS